jgi:integrase
MERHEICGGRVLLYKRENSRLWQCSTYLGRNLRKSTKQESLALAKEVAEDWYHTLRGYYRAGEIRTGKTFKFAAEQFLREFEAMTVGERSPSYVASQQWRIEKHLIPFFKGCFLSEVTSSKVQEYRIHRAMNARTKKPTARATIHQEIVALRQILKCARLHGWIDHLPDLKAPFRASGKLGHRAWFSKDEYRQLYEATRERAKTPLNNRWKWECEQLHDYVLFMANTGLRPDEASRLQHRDVEIVFDEATQTTILDIEVRGKRGVGRCKSTSQAVRPLRRLIARNRPGPTDPVFPGNHSELLKTILQELDLRTDRDGKRRSAYSLRHTYISFRLLEGADIYAIAKNCRTSVEMIQKHYAQHIKTSIDAAAVNVMRKKPRRPASRPSFRRTRGRRKTLGASAA